MVALLVHQQEANQLNSQLQFALIYLGSGPAAVKRILVVMHGVMNVSALGSQPGQLEVDLGIFGIGFPQPKQSLLGLCIMIAGCQSVG